MKLSITKYKFSEGSDPFKMCTYVYFLSDTICAPPIKICDQIKRLEKEDPTIKKIIFSLHEKHKCNKFSLVFIGYKTGIINVEMGP